jgi:hypothetical protein
MPLHAPTRAQSASAPHRTAYQARTPLPPVPRLALPPAADSPELHKVIHGLLERQLFPLTVGAPGAPEPETAHALLAASPQGAPAVLRTAWACLGLVTRGLVMRGHPAGDGVLAGVLGMLSEADAELAAGDADVAMETGAGACAWPAPQGGLVVRQAARLFGEILRSPRDASKEQLDDCTAAESQQQPPGAAAAAAAASPPTLPGLTSEAHAVARPLWQQRFYTMQSGALLRALTSLPAAAASLAPPGSQGGVPGEGEGEGAGPTPPLILALSHLISGAPPGVLRADWRRVLPWVPRCLAAVLAGWRWRRRQQAGAPDLGAAGSEGEAEERGLVLALLDVVCEALMAEEGAAAGQASP